MVRFSREELESFRDGHVPDTIGRGLRLLLVGINPGLWSAATRSHFARPGNRFYPALHRAGITASVIDAGDGMKPEDRRHLIDRGVGITNIVARATARADELTAAELTAGWATLAAKVGRRRPHVVAVLGVTAYRQAVAEPKAQMGHQADGIGGAELWALPNPSGLNAHETVDSLADWYGRAAAAAGIELFTRS